MHMRLIDCISARGRGVGNLMGRRGLWHSIIRVSIRSLNRILN